MSEPESKEQSKMFVALFHAFFDLTFNWLEKLLHFDTFIIFCSFKARSSKWLLTLTLKWIDAFLVTPVLRDIFFGFDTVAFFSLIASKRTVGFLKVKYVQYISPLVEAVCYKNSTKIMTEFWSILTRETKRLCNFVEILQELFNNFHVAIFVLGIKHFFFSR